MPTLDSGFKHFISGTIILFLQNGTRESRLQGTSTSFCHAITKADLAMPFLSMVDKPLNEFRVPQLPSGEP